VNDEVLAAGDAVMEAHGAVTPAHLDALQTLSDAYLTPAQRAYARRFYRDVSSDMPASAPWPAPERIRPEIVTIFVVNAVGHDPLSARAWAAYRLLHVAATIEATRRITERLPSR